MRGERNLPVTASPCQPPLGKGAEGTGGTDCHSQCAHWLRNDMVFHGARGKSGRRGYKRCGKTGRRGNRRSAASGGRSELISRKCPDWRPQQWPGIGWHDGGQPPAPTKAYLVVRRGGGLCPSRGRGRTPPLRKRNKKCGGERNPPVTALPCQPPLGKGAEEDGGKQRVFDAIKPPPGAGALEGVCGEGGLRRGGLFGVCRFWNQSSVWAAATALEMICTSWAGSSFSGTSSSAKWR